MGLHQLSELRPQAVVLRCVTRALASPEYLIEPSVDVQNEEDVLRTFAPRIAAQTWGGSENQKSSTLLELIQFSSRTLTASDFGVGLLMEGHSGSNPESRPILLE